MATEERKKLSLFLSKEHHEKLKILAGQRDQKLYEVAQDAITQYLDQFQIQLTITKIVPEPKEQPEECLEEITIEEQTEEA